jgi:hypothetical protein
VLVVFGDSIAAGYGVEPGQSFPDDLQKKLDAQGWPWRVVNLGISGDTTEGGASRTDSATSLQPAIVILELGGNDGLRGLPQAITRQNLAAMIQAFQGAGARVVLAGMTLPPNYGADYIQGFQKIYKDLAAQYRLTLIPFLLSDMITPDLRYFPRAPRSSRRQCCAPSSPCSARLPFHHGEIRHGKIRYQKAHGTRLSVCYLQERNDGSRAPSGGFFYPNETPIVRSSCHCRARVGAGDH